MNFSLRISLIVLVTAGLLLLAPGFTIAHSALHHSVPANGSEITEVPSHLILSFSKRIRLTRVSLTGHDDSVIDLDLDNHKSFDTEFAIPLTDLQSGSYTVDWRGLSDDGHIVSETFSFRVR